METQETPLDRAFELFKRFWAFAAAIPLAYAALWILPDDPIVLKIVIASLIPMLILLITYSYSLLKSERERRNKNDDNGGVCTGNPVLGPNPVRFLRFNKLLEKCIEVTQDQRTLLPFSISPSSEVQIRFAATSPVKISIHDKWHVDREDFRRPILNESEAYELDRQVNLDEGDYSLSVTTAKRRSKVRIEVNQLVGDINILSR